ncbi:MAG: hypothetical protein ABI068_04180 [Ktedonobacterales bacterium]
MSNFRSEDFEGPANIPVDLFSAEQQDQQSAFRAGYNRTMREFAWALARGYAPTERQMVLALTQTMRVYTAARGGKPIGGQRPDALRGRADALRMLIRQGVAAQPTRSVQRDDRDE